MENIKYKNIFVTTWLIDNPKAIVIISHGMTEHVRRYDDFATFLNNHGYAVYGIHQIGHGDAIKDVKGHFEKDDFFRCGDNLQTLIDKAKNDYPNKKVYLFGHSMGSFISQYYISTYGKNIDGVILCGSNAPGANYTVSKVLANTLFLFADNKKPGYFLNKMAFGSFNKHFKPNRTTADWLSRDNNEVDKYLNDDLCGFICSVGFFKEFLKGLASLKGLQNKIPLSLPIYLIAGDNDPVSNMGVGISKLYNQYKKINIKDLSMKLYPGARHEILNEINKEEVKKDILNWLDSHVDFKEKNLYN